MMAVLVVTIPKSGAWEVDGKPLASHDELLVVARSAFGRDVSTRAAIRADVETPWGDVVHAIDLLKQGGIVKLGFVVAPPSPAPQATSTAH
jgi:biopolymer transport protein ExbD